MIKKITINVLINEPLLQLIYLLINTEYINDTKTPSGSI